MQVKNLRAYAIYLPYAGAKPNRGWKLGAGCLSPELPTDRYYDPLLQRDWARKWIELVFNSMDVATLGPAVASLLTQAPAPEAGPVSVAGREPDKDLAKESKAQEPEVKAQTVAPKEVTSEAKAQKIAPKPVATDIFSQGSDTVAPVIEPRIKPDTSAEKVTGKHFCPLCFKERSELKVYPPVPIAVCKFCYRTRNSKGKWEETVVPSAPEAAPVATAPRADGPPPQPATGVPVISLADLARQNLEAEHQRLLAGPMGSPLDSVDKMQRAGKLKGPPPSPPDYQSRT